MSTTTHPSESTITRAIEPFTFFNSDSFLCNRTIDGELYRFELLENDLPVAKFSLVRKDDLAFSPQNAPYGSLEYLRHVPIGQVQKFMGEIIEWCSDSGIQSIQVIQPPDCYPVQDPADFLDSFDVQLLHTDINQHLPVNKDYSDRFSKLEKYQLKRCRWEGFRSNKEGIEALQEAYQLLVTARGRKRFPVTMSFDNLLDMFEKHPDHYHLFTVRDKKQLIAMAVAIHIHPQLLYIFYLADHSDYLAESPTVMVVDTVMKFALDNGYKQVDLGISSVKGKVNQGLFNFKKNLGCIQGKKKTVLIKP